jgi:hypothetical protein
VNYKEKLDGLTEEERKELMDCSNWEVLSQLLNGSIATYSGLVELLTRKLDEILSRREPPKPLFDWWRPEYGRGFSAIDNDGSISAEEWTDHAFDFLALKIGNVFPSVAAAEAESLRTTARRFYEHCCRVANGGALLPPGKSDTWIWSIVNDKDGDGVYWSNRAWLHHKGVPGVADKETALAIRAAMIEKNLLEAYFGVDAWAR